MAVVLALVLSGFVAGIARRDAAALAEVGRPDAPPAFRSGAQRSEAHLADIAGTLKRIDERLARLEKLAVQNLAREAKAAATEDRR